MTQLKNISEVQPESSKIVATTSGVKADSKESQYQIGQMYGQFKVENYSTTTTSRTDQYDFAHNLQFIGDAVIQAEIVVDSMLSPYLLIKDEYETKLPALKQLGSETDVLGYKVVIVDSKVSGLVEILREAYKSVDKKYTVEIQVTELQIQRGAPKMDSIMITKIIGQPKIVSIEDRD